MMNINLVKEIYDERSIDSVKITENNISAILIRNENRVYNKFKQS